MSRPFRSRQPDLNHDSDFLAVFTDTEACLRHNRRMDAPQRYEWDEVERASNLARFGLDFAEMAHFHWDSAAILIDGFTAGGRRRLRAIGYIRGRFCVAVLTYRKGAMQLVSLRRANTRKSQRHEG